MTQIFYRHPNLPTLELRYGTTSEYCYAPHTHAEYSLGVVLSGQARYQYQQLNYDICLNDTMLIAPNIPHACNTSNCTSWEYLMLYIDCDYWQTLCEAFNCKPLVTGKPKQDRYLARQLLSLQQLWSMNAVCAIDIESQWIECFQYLCEGCEVDDVDRTMSKHSLDEAITWLHQHITEEINLSEWAAQVGLPRHQLLRQFRREIGMSPHQYLLNQRIQLAKTWLKLGESAADVTYRLGFADQSHFQRTFKRYTAVTPKHYQTVNK